MTSAVGIPGWGGKSSSAVINNALVYDRQAATRMRRVLTGECTRTLSQTHTQARTHQSRSACEKDSKRGCPRSRQGRSNATATGENVSQLENMQFNISNCSRGQWRNAAAACARTQRMVVRFEIGCFFSSIWGIWTQVNDLPRNSNRYLMGCIVVPLCSGRDGRHM